MPGKLRDLTGQRFGRLVVTEHSHVKPRGGRGFLHYWKCQCDCGNVTRVLGWSLVQSLVKSCGCYCREMKSLRSRKDVRHQDNPAYGSWKSMKTRCYGNHKHRKNYRDRGITVCGRWIRSFDAFFEDVGARPTPKHSIDRINNEGNYDCGKCPDCLSRGVTKCNCQWSLPKQQGRNRRNNRLLTFQGKSLTVTEWSEITGFGITTIRQRLVREWDIESTLTVEPSYANKTRGLCAREQD